jgi:phospholipid/cholesterol/gamma-HCH transport system permease protein
MNLTWHCHSRLINYYLPLVGRFCYLIWQTLKCCVSRPIYGGRIVEQIKKLGFDSLLITVVIGITMGLVMTLNFGHGLMKFGGTMYVPKLVSLSLAREMAPIFTALLVTGRIGSGMAAEISSMAVTQQIDALRALGTSPIRVLVVPRFLGALISLPLLSMLALALGLLGGLFIAVNDLGIPYETYLASVFETIKMRDLVSCILKSGFFSIIISMVACFVALGVKEGTRGVGNATTKVVVASSIIIMVSDYFLSKLFIIFIL